MQVSVLTTPANVFHILRRQMNRQFRKPLINFFSKSLLRHPLARSPIEDFTGESHFQWIIPDPFHEGGSLATQDFHLAPHDEVDRVILCSGQVFTALFKHRQSNDLRKTAITRIEQLNPFPWAQLKENLDSYPNAKTIVWCQEEPLNAGPWSFTQPRIETLLNHTEHHYHKHVMYAGRNPSASVATGLKSTHMKEEQEFLDMAWRVKQDKLKGQE